VKKLGNKNKFTGAIFAALFPFKTTKKGFQTQTVKKDGKIEQKTTRCATISSVNSKNFA
jgi:hypothetical protein